MKFVNQLYYLLSAYDAIPDGVAPQRITVKHFKTQIKEERNELQIKNEM